MKFCVTAGLNLFLSIIFGSFTSFTARADVVRTEAGEHLCYVPGAGGGKSYVFKELPAQAEALGLPFVSFNIGKNQSVEAHAARLVKLIQDKVMLDPQFSCHVAAYSMGGIVVKYALKHLEFSDPRPSDVKLKDVVKSMVTLATPHKGTPLPRLVKPYLGTLDPGREQLAEEAIWKFNDPKSELYSPDPKGIPLYSFKTKMRDEAQAVTLVERLGFQAIHEDAKQRGLSAGRDNDGIVPTDSQAFGRVLATLTVPHSYFSNRIETARPTLPEFFKTYWAWLHADEKAPEDPLEALDILVDL